MDKEFLNKFKYILVTGPQRSGTRIAAKIIAHDVGHRYVDETEIHTDSLYTLVWLLSGDERVVVQCPALSRYVHFFGDRDDVLIVWMVRARWDIKASQERIGWEWELLEQFRYDTTRPIAQAKHRYWAFTQRPVIKHWYEVHYEKLSDHPLWVPKERRADFTFNQTEV
jgi:hypothetical protein